LRACGLWEHSLGIGGPFGRLSLCRQNHVSWETETRFAETGSNGPPGRVAVVIGRFVRWVAEVAGILWLTGAVTSNARQLTNAGTPKSLRFERAMGLRKFCRKFPKPSRVMRGSLIRPRTPVIVVDNLVMIVDARNQE
jgi:hypothetical protein